MHGAARAVWPVVATVIAACASTPAPEARRASDDAVADWLLVYWLPYDNDLAAVAADVLEALLRARGRGVGRVDVVVQIDLPGDDGMTRVELDAEGRRDTPLPGRDDSASAGELADLLDWASGRHPARRIAIALLGHSRRLEELSPDTDENGALRWMRLEELAGRLDAFRSDLPAASDVELVFLQTCGKASVEVAWALRRSARFLLASQAPLGAPNHYYGGALNALRAVPDMDGAALADVISVAERPDMFVGLTLVDGSAIDDMPVLVEETAVETPSPLPSRALAESVFVYGGDALVDVQALLAARRARAPAATPALDRLADVLAHDVVVWHRQSTLPAAEAAVGLPAAGPETGLWVRLHVAGDGGPFGALAAVDP